MTYPDLWDRIKLMDILDLALALILAKVLGEIFIRMRQMEVVGEILAGIFFAFLMGFSTLPIYLEGSIFEFFADAGVIMLMFLAGLETSLRDVAKAGKRGALTALAGALLPMTLCSLFSWKILHLQPRQALVAGSIFTATSVGVTVRALLEINKLRTPSGTTIVTAAVIDDIIGILILTFILGESSPLRLLMGFFILSITLFVLYSGPVEWMMRALKEKFHSPTAILSVSFGFALLISSLTEKIGLSPITGAYFAGVLIGKTKEKRLIVEPFEKIAYSIFVPIFFVKVGSLFDVRIFSGVRPLFFFLIPLGAFGKFAGCTFGAWRGGLSFKDSTRVGTGMVPLMEVALVIATYAYTHGIFSGRLGVDMVSITIIYVLFFTLLVPVLMKFLYREG
ncbi:cation:proton antiporter [bacterium]|nr:MAG: cation:proton antiporter [bacterium]